MIEPTDRVIAKTLARSLHELVKHIDVSDVEAAFLLADIITAKITKGNKELGRAIINLLREVSEDIRAENEGLASSTVGQPVAPPWNEDAGSGA